MSDAGERRYKPTHRKPTHRKPTHQEIAVRAYRMWKRESLQPGYTDVIGAESAVPNWLRAERTLLMEDPLSWACGACAAQPGEPCVWSEPRPSELYHAERLEAATAHSDDAAEIEDFDTGERP